MMVKRILRVAGLLALGAGGLLLIQRFTGGPPHSATRPPSAATPSVVPVAAGIQTLSLSPDAVTRAGIRTESLAATAGTATLRLPGTVEPQAYGLVDVTPIVSGTVLAVNVELGAVVRQGTVVARLRSPELTDEVRRWLTLRAEGDVAAKRLARTEALARIGAASRQDVEQDQAGQVRVSTDLGTSRSRLARLGLTDARLSALRDGDALPETFDVLAPASGVVIRRTANPGQNIDASQAVVTLADTSLVWIMADVFEADLAQIRVGQPALVTSDAFPGRDWNGRLVYIEPEVSRETRTVRVRIEVPNADSVLRFGMFVSASIGGSSSADRLTVPRSALQTIGAVTVVYVMVQGGRYQERVVSIGAAVGDRVVVTTGLRAGDHIVTAGSFALRAERERLAWPAPAMPPPAASVASPSKIDTPQVITRVIEITAAGLVPNRVSVPPNQEVNLVFIRRVEDSCGAEVAIPDLGIRRDLPINQRVTIRLPPRPPGELSFTCGLNMLRGVIIVGNGA